MPSKCNKVKNPCKICLESVNNKSGLQCQGACKKWVHFKCLNYTPGKINDIKQGVIKVTCPCPDCKTTKPTEYRTDEPFSCTNIQCPSNLPRSCTSTTCPSNQNTPPAPLLVCEKNACKLNKATNEACNTANQSCPAAASSASSSSGFAGDSANKNKDGGQAMNVVEQICTTVGTLTKQINSLMVEMKHLIAKNQGNSGNSKPKSCNCPGNPNRK